MRIGVIGGGLMGLATAERLCALGHPTVVFERASQAGGLATWHDFGPFVWDRFYHVILPTDAQLLGFFDRLGLTPEIRWRATQTGYYVDQAFFSLSTNIDFLRFPLLSIWNKLRLAFTILYCSRINDWQRLEQIPVEDWLVRTCGRAVFEKFWKPLLLAKLGENYKRVSAVFIWSYIKRLFSARDATAQKEHLGHVSGGYRRVFDVVEARIRGAGGQLRLESAVSAVRPVPGGGIEVVADGAAERFDKVIFTSPVNVLRATVEPSLVDVPVAGGDIEYLGVICMVLITKRPIMPYYVLNIGDERIPFTGVVGMSNIVDPAETAGLHLTYLPKYLLSDDPLLARSDDEIRALFTPGLRQMFPELDPTDIESARVHRALRVQPLQVLGYSRLVPRLETRHPDFFVLNTSQFVNSTLNNNEVIGSVDRFFDTFGHHFEVPAGAAVDPAATRLSAVGGAS